MQRPEDAALEMQQPPDSIEPKGGRDHKCSGQFLEPNENDNSQKHANRFSYQRQPEVSLSKWRYGKRHAVEQPIPLIVRHLSFKQLMHDEALPPNRYSTAEVR
jgi:hypothetical protein